MRLAQTAQGECHFTSISHEDIDKLEGLFAQPVNQDGYLMWAVPEWLKQLRWTANLRDILLITHKQV